MTRVGRPLLLLSGVVAAGLLFRSLPQEGAGAWLGRLGGDHGTGAALRCVAVGAILCALGVPRQIIAYAFGLGFGAWIGGGLAMAAALIGCVADLAWARGVARDWVRRRLGRRLARLDARLAARPFLATLALRLLPVGSNVLLNLAAGVSGVPVLPFLAASALGYVPQTAVFALLGAGARIGHAAQLGLGAALFVLAGLLGAAVLRRDPADALSA